MDGLNIYTDGACSGKQFDANVGGWGAILEFGEHVKELHGGEVNTTNNRMELAAVIAAFRALKRGGLKIRVFTDSSYVATCFRDRWYINWRKNGWKNAKKEPVENRELWEELLALVEQNEVSFYRVKGHVNLDSAALTPAQADKLYAKFKEWNGASFTRRDFEYVTTMNNRADELANIAMDELRAEKR